MNKNHSDYRNILTCSRRNFSIHSLELKLNSLETALHFSIALGTRASCSISGRLKSSEPCQNTLPPSASRRQIQFLSLELRKIKEQRTLNYCKIILRLIKGYT